MGLKRNDKELYVQTFLRNFMTIHNIIYKVIIQLSIVDSNIKIMYCFIGTDTIPYHFHLFSKVSIPSSTAHYLFIIYHTHASNHGFIYYIS